MVLSIIDPDSNHMVVSIIIPFICLMITALFCETAISLLNQLWCIYLYFYYMQTCVNSEAYTCIFVSYVPSIWQLRFGKS